MRFRFHPLFETVFAEHVTLAFKPTAAEASRLFAKLAVGTPVIVRVVGHAADSIVQVSKRGIVLNGLPYLPTAVGHRPALSRSRRGTGAVKCAG